MNIRKPHPDSCEQFQTIQKPNGNYKTERCYSYVGLLCEKEGWLKMKKPNCKIFGNLFVGTIIFVGVQGEEFTDCPITAEELNSPPWYGLLEEV